MSFSWKTARNIMRKDQGISSDVQRLEELISLVFLRIYDALEEEGFVTTVHGKGTFVSETNKDRIYEEQVRDVEKDMAKAVLKARQSGIKDDDIRSIFDMIMEDK